MKRLYEELLHFHLKNFRQMAFIAGPRQVGKTSIGKCLRKKAKQFYYFNWDNQNDREQIIKGPREIAKIVGLEKIQERKALIVFDEVHKYRKWKQFLKGFFDAYEDQCQIIVMGSAKLNVYKAGGDSLMGRYFLYRIHPLSVAELIRPLIGKTEIHSPKKISPTAFKNLFKFGGFPEPYIKKNHRFSRNWQRLRREQLIQEDIRDLNQVQEISQLEILAKVLKEQTSQLLNYNSLANLINVSAPTVKRWLTCLESFYYCFKIHPWSKNVKRSLKKEPKYYLWDWTLIQDEGKKKENFVASHLLKAVHQWTDCGFGEYQLHFLRDKEKREVDFLVTKNHEPFFLVEVKGSNHAGITKSLYYFQKEIGAKHAFQVVFNEEYISMNCFRYKRPVIVPIQTFLSQLI